MSQNPQPQFELAWQSLRPSLEWAKEFGLIFVFGADARGKEALFRRADEVMRGQVRPFERPTVKSALDYANTLMPILVDQASSQSAAGLPLWLDLDGNPHDPAWNAARTNFLSRLNERRARLVRENTRSVVLVLPGDWTKLAAEAAPDLWTIRQPSVYLQSGVAGVGVAEGQHEAPNMAKISSSEPESPQFSRNQELPSAVRRWQQGALSDASGELTVWDGTLASEAAFDAGYTQLALDIARKTVDLAKTAVEKQGKTPERLRDLSVSMNKLGDVARALGQLDDARAAYAEGEKLSRALIDEFGKTPERLRDLSVSMNKLGDVASALGQLDDARAAYAEGEKLSRALIDVYGETVPALETLAYHAARLGQLLERSGEQKDAGVRLANARLLYQRLALAMPYEARYRAMLVELGEPTLANTVPKH